MRISLIAGMLVMFLGTSARADEVKPWARDVPEAQQARANEMFAEANTLFEQGSHAAALAKYRAAIALWDHPMIRFNMAVTLIRLDQLVEAADALDAALRFGRQPFTADLYTQALDYDHLIRGRVGMISAECSQHDVHVLLDGKRWFACPGSKHVRVLAGEHVLVAEGRGYYTKSRQVFLAGAATPQFALSLAPVEQHVRYRIARWIPWTVAGAGVVLAASGLGSWFAGKTNGDRFEVQYAIECASRCTDSLADHPDLRALRDRAEREGDIGVGLMMTGGVLAIGGLAWATFLNRPTPVALQIDVGGENSAMVRATWRFP